jgi:Mce-associated membrane protein
VRTKAMDPSGLEDMLDLEESHDDAAPLGDVADGALADVGPELDTPRRRWIRSDATTLGLTAGVLCVCLLAGLVSWLGVTAYEARATQQERQLFLQAGRQGALDLTTIRYTDVDADVQRVLDASTGKFYDEFKARTSDFAAAVRQAQSSSTGTVTEAGIESVDGDTARVLVSIAVRTATAQAQDPQPRYWRMRVTVTKVQDPLPKVVDVEFVP